MLILFIFLYSVVQLRQYMIKPYLFILLNFIFVIFQIAHLYRSDIGVITAIYGYCLYMLPVNLISLSRIIAHTNSVHFFAKSILYATFPNLLMALLQTLVPNSRYSRGIIDESNATTIGGYSRAYGTFSSPAGYAIFLSILTACVLIFLANQSLSIRFIFYVQLVVLYAVSGSRTVFFSLAIILISKFISSIFFEKQKLLAVTLKALLSLFIVIIVTSQSLNIGPLNAFLTRVSIARTEENTVMRIFDNVFGFTEFFYQPFFGSGLGAYAIGTVGYTNRAQWIELDLIRNIYELGTIFGVSWIAFRFSLFIGMTTISLRRCNSQALILFSSIAPYLLFGVISGQSTISIGCWLVIMFANSSLIAYRKND
jgi:hypothetical protein